MKARKVYSKIVGILSGLLLCYPIKDLFDLLRPHAADGNYLDFYEAIVMLFEILSPVFAIIIGLIASAIGITLLNESKKYSYGNASEFIVFILELILTVIFQFLFSTILGGIAILLGVIMNKLFIIGLIGVIIFIFILAFIFIPLW